MPPIKPFPEYRWRWCSNEPTENLLLPPIFLGVLRVLAAHDGQSPSDLSVLNDLARVGEETDSPVNLVRTPERNLIRNSGQYWKATGLLFPEGGIIRVTPLGRRVAEGLVTRDEFAAIMVQQTVLPNPWVDPPSLIQKWQNAALEIKPFRLILQVMEDLGRSHGGIDAAYITPFELISICIPLAGTRAPVATIARNIAQHRKGRLDLSGWPDCAPGANDKRLAKEFLRFLDKFGICGRVAGKSSENDRYQLAALGDLPAFADAGQTMFDEAADTDSIVTAARDSQLPLLIERQRVLVSVLARPGQAQFRNDLLKAYNTTCLLTRDTIPEILEAAHIRPVEHDGPDDVANGLMLRVDIHRLFDSGNIRIRPTGELVLSEALRASNSYRNLPERINLPAFVSREHLEWRYQYL